MTRALCVGDLHLGCGSDYGREPGERLREQEAVWARALEIGRKRRADVVLFAGDAFHKARPSADEMLAFARPLIAHRYAGGAAVIAIPGNHDYGSANGGLGLEVFHEAGLLTLAREPIVHNLFEVSVACLPWAPPSRVVAAAGGGDRDEIHQVAAETLTTVAKGLRDQTAGPCVLLTHFPIAPAVTPDGADVGLFRGVVLEAAALDKLGFDAICAGDIHKRQYLDAEERQFFVGSPMPLTFGEAKCDHGVWILDLNDDELETSFVPIESRRFVTLDIDGLALSTAGPRPDLCYDTEADGIDGAIVKVRIAATSEQARRIDVAALKRELLADGAWKVWAVQVEVEREERARVEGLDESLDELQALDLYLAERGVNGTRGARLRDLTEAYLQEARA